ncbi:ATP-binding protein [Streptomyces mayonensis]|uniref:ATP-binding protein n=1 Tax=Streptomyces mayonensis TaxID=2750816 RepID=UPI001C1DF9BD|nr:ATP-binding protein [Streptomyces sp. A108]MBU6530754.1 sensor histidine kinase [Streptomyces sp. A108]
MTELILTVTALLAVAAVGAAWRFRRTGDQARRRADQLREHADRLTLQLVAAEQCVGHLSATVIPATAKGGQGGAAPEAGLMVPAALDGTPLAERLRAVPATVASAVDAVRTQERAAADRVAANTADQVRQDAEQQVAQVRQDTERQIEQVRQESVGVARAAVRGFANNVVARSARLGRTVSQGVRRHISDEAYATLVEIDHLAQQMLLTASGYAVLAGDKLSRRWPATTLTDIVRAAMGRIEGYERIKHPEMGAVVVEGRAVEGVVHAVAVLLDNALRYSPPAASVHVSLEQGHHACFLIVDDAGLRMDDERLLWASDVMSGEQRDDITRLGAHPQTGLRVASLLAESYGFRVELTAPNIYQGTRAMVVLPKNLLVDPSAAHPAVHAADRPAVASSGASSVTPDGAPAGIVPAPSAPVDEPAPPVPAPAPAAQSSAPFAAEPAAAGPAPEAVAGPVEEQEPAHERPGFTREPASAYERPEFTREPAYERAESAQESAHRQPEHERDHGYESVHGPADAHPAPATAPTASASASASTEPAPGPATPGAGTSAATGPAATTASGLTVRRRSTAPAPARRPAAPDATEPGRPAVAAAWAAGTRRGRQGDATGPAGTDATHTAGRDAAHDEGH